MFMFEFILFMSFTENSKYMSSAEHIVLHDMLFNKLHKSFIQMLNRNVPKVFL